MHVGSRVVTEERIQVGYLKESLKMVFASLMSLDAEAGDMAVMAVGGDGVRRYWFRWRICS
jgi:hypothetical protein